MTDFLLGHYAYWFTILLMAIGLYGLMIKRNLVKKTIGLQIFQMGIILFFVSMSTKQDAAVPIKSDQIPVAEAANYMNPLPQTLMLTAIVVGVATLGVAMTLLVAIYKRYHTLNEQELVEKQQ